MTRTLFVAYDLEQVEDAVAHAKEGGEVLCINFWVERALARRGIAYRSYAECQPPRFGDEPPADAAQVAAREWYRVPGMRFFEHKGIPLGEALESGFAIYLGRLLHYRAVFERILDANPTAHLVVPYPTARVLATTGPLTHFEMSVVVDVAHAAAVSRHLPFETRGEAPSPSKRHAHPGPRWHTTVVALYNAVVGCAPHRRVKIYATEYWRNIEPFIERMDNTELALMDRSELRNVPWREMWRHRIRLVHPRDVVDTRARRTAHESMERFRAEWPVARAALVSHRAFDLIGWSLVEPVLTYLVCVYAERIITEIEACERVLRRERPDTVLLRVSISSYQTHFFVLARIARQLSIPSIEIQHAGAHVDPRSVYSRLEADYLASYGPYVREWYERIGTAGERVLPIGSPRFDRCTVEYDGASARGARLLQSAGLNPAQPTLLVAVPDVQTDSYMLADFLYAIRAAQEGVPGLQVILKFRNEQRPTELRDFIGELFPSATACMDTENLFSLLRASDAAVCGNSTVIYEAMLAGTPLLLYPWRVSDTYHAQMYASAAPILYSAPELADSVVKIFRDEAYRTELLARHKRFLGGYSFDGRSSDRLASLLRAPLPPRP